ncbi:MAG: copper resistance protein CopC [Acidimicrobiales bacterium]
MVVEHIARRSSRRSLRLLAALAVGVLANWPSSVAAHANLLAASPAVGQPAGGTIDRVQLVFDEPITELDAAIEGPDGRLLDATVATITPQQFELAFAPLADEGIYRVRYAFLSIDDDRVELGHAFEFDRTAPAPLPISGPTIVERSGTSWRTWLVLVPVIVAVIALAERLRRRRRALARITA